MDYINNIVKVSSVEGSKQQGISSNKETLQQGISSKHYNVLTLIINNTKCFDRRDNTFILSNRKIADKVKVSPSKVDQLFRELRKKGLLKKVRSVNQLVKNGIVNNNPLYNMLDPKYLFISYIKSDIFIICALWDLEDISLVREWRGLCKRFNCHVDPMTGEMTKFNWYYVERVANSYYLYDRCYRKGSKTPSQSSRPEAKFSIEDADYYD